MSAALERIGVVCESGFVMRPLGIYVTKAITFFMADGSLQEYRLDDPKVPLPSFRALVPIA